MAKFELRKLEEWKELGELDNIEGDDFLGDPWASDTPRLVKSSTRGHSYDVVLFARIGLHCHNFEKITSFKGEDGGGPWGNPWNEDSAAIDDSYKGPMPKWFSDEALARDHKKFYVVQESELHENHDWLQLLMEVAFFAATYRGVDSCKPLKIEEVVVETLEEHTTDAREKLKADNAIFYLSYKWSGGPSKHAIIRKTMDGKPGHMCIEVAFTNEQDQTTR